MSDENIKMLEKNRNALEESEKKETFCNLLEETEENDMVFIDQSLKDELIIGIDNGQVWYLNSRYDAVGAAEKWVEGLQKYNYTTSFMVFGFGNGMHVRKLRELYPKNLIVVYEPNANVLKTVLSEIDISDLLEDNDLVILCGEEREQQFIEVVQIVVNYSRMSNICWLMLPNYRNVYPEECRKVLKFYKEWAESNVMSRNTMILFEEEVVDNVLGNLWDMLKNCTIYSLREQIQKQHVEKYPAIVVSAGPSLDKNVEDLKLVQGRALLIVVDTALKTVLNAGITPDLTITVDPHKPLILFDDERIKNIPMVLCTQSNHKVLEQQKGKKIYFSDGYKYITELYHKYDLEVGELESGGSVANLAFSLATYLGFQTIILVGQDLAYPDNKEHTSVAYGSTEKNEIDFSKNKYIEVEDINGNKVWTEGNMDAYRKWFEKQIVRFSSLRVIDATEGGAKIVGSEIMTLKNAISRECEGLKSMNMRQIVEGIEKTFDDTQLIEINKMIKEMPNQLDEMKKSITEGIQWYKDLNERYQEKDYLKVKSLSTKVNDLLQTIEEEPMMSMVNMLNNRESFIFQAKLYDIQKEEQNEIEYISTMGVDLFQSYINAIERLKEKLKILFESMKEFPI